MNDIDIDIVQVIRAAGIDLHQHGDLYRCICPIHRTAQGTPEKSPSFTVYPKTNSWYCFGCSVGGDAITFCTTFYQEDYKSALRRLGIADELYSPNKLKNKLISTTQEDKNKFINLWLEINKVIYTKKIYFTPLVGQLDHILFLNEDEIIYALQEIKKSIFK